MAVPTPPTTTQAEPLYRLDGVSKRYRKGEVSVTALDDVDLAISAGEWLAVQGRTGSGKTTLLQMLGAMDRPDAGTLEFAGTELTGISEGRLTRLRGSSIGFVFQAFNLIPTLSAAENVEAALVPLNVPGGERRARALDALASVGLADRSSHLPSELSGGQQQRVGIARALCKAPRVLLADEPTGNLDVDTREEIMALLAALWGERGLTLVLVTHDDAVADRAQRVVSMSNGRVSTERGGHLAA